MIASRLMAVVATLIERAQALDFRVSEETGVVALEETDLATLIELLTASVDTAGQLLDHYDQAADEPAGEETRADATEIADLAFFARTQIRETAKALAQARATTSIWTVLAQADGAQRRMLKSLIALESAAREHEGLPVIERRWVVLAESLEIRRAYSQFQRSIVRHEDPSDEQLRPNLRDALRRISILRDRTIYPFLRLDDRRQIHGFKQRIEAWIAREGSLRDGRRLWQDLVGFARLLHLVNNRQELLQHDRDIVQRAMALLFHDDTSPEQVSPALMTSLESLIGRDEELDDILLGTRPLPPASLRAPLTRLHRTLSR